MTPEQFIAKWKSATLKERSAAQTHFNDLCAMLGVESPAEADPDGTWYCFERGAKKTTGGKGWADVWKRDCFGWEYKGKGKDLDAAYAQLQQYAVALESPPLLIVCDLETFRIHTNWTNTVSMVHEIALEELADAGLRAKLKYCFTDPDRLKPDKTRDALTKDQADVFAKLAHTLRQRGFDPKMVAHFVNRLVFCMFAEDVDLLPGALFAKTLRHCFAKPEEFQQVCAALFKAMAERDGRFGLDRVEWFNGGLFDDDTVLALTRSDIGVVLAAAQTNWADVDPSIFGTLFERGLDPANRVQLGAHYTDRDKIMLIVEPVVLRPWRARWAETKAKIAAEAKKGKPANLAKAQKLLDGFTDDLAAIRILDPACGSGNFLYLALLALKDLEHQANLESEQLGLKRGAPKVGPQVVKGIEINEYAAELARVTIWIGEIQWMKRHGFDVARNPILKPLDTIENRDALLAENGMKEAEWPKADYIIGNPPFLGDRKMIRGLGETYVDVLRRKYEGRIPGGADLVCYWFGKAGECISSNKTKRAGLVATNSIRGGANRKVLDRIVEQTEIFEAWDDEPWVLDGAAVRVSLVCFGESEGQAPQLNGREVGGILSDLTAINEESGLDITKARPLDENADTAFIGTQKNGPFDIPGDQARRMLEQALNPNGKPNTDVIRPWINGSGIVQQRDDRWIIDFGPRMSEQDAALYERPFEHVLTHVRPTRIGLRRQWHRTKWWLHGDPRPAMRMAIEKCSRYIATPRVAKHRVFAWMHRHVLPDSAVVAVARDDDTTFGILHGRFHELWSLRMGTSLEDRPRYTPSTCFETFPFPAGLTPNIPAKDYADDPRARKIAAAARRLNELREAWLNPPDLVKREPEVVPGYPDRILPKDAKAAKILAKRTLTNLYNERPAWLDHAHKELDAAVAEAYGWPVDLSDEEILKRLFDLNQDRAKAQGPAKERKPKGKAEDD
ncbi:MAG TPA: class I SAM-dependent DNA methyltransferase [Alphaproteobacteria bacterium]|nr:class I SAM-dependent DNA methyltransferase [Alphaproteobacteria bacterium]